jgi:hypothetical protein
VVGSKAPNRVFELEQRIIGADGSFGWDPKLVELPQYRLKPLVGAPRPYLCPT